MKKNEKIIIIIIIAVLICIIGILIFFNWNKIFKGKNNSSEVIEEKNTISNLKIVGSWIYDENDSFVYEFKSNNTGIYHVGKTEINFTYELTKKTISFLYENFDDEIESEYIIKDNVLTIKDTFGDDLSYIRKGSKQEETKKDDVKKEETNTNTNTNTNNSNNSNKNTNTNTNTNSNANNSINNTNTNNNNNNNTNTNTIDDSSNTDSDMTIAEKLNDYRNHPEKYYTISDGENNLLDYLGFEEGLNLKYLETVVVYDEQFNTYDFYYKFDVRKNNGVNYSHIDNYYIIVDEFGGGIYDSESFINTFGFE